MSKSVARSSLNSDQTAAAAATIHTVNKIKKEAWVSDSLANSCYGCGADFTLTRRKHHCRLCGNCFCDSCSSKRLTHRKKRDNNNEDEPTNRRTGLLNSFKAGITALTGDIKQIRVCDTCYETEKMLQSSANGSGPPTVEMHLDSSDDEKGGDHSAANSNSTSAATATAGSNNAPSSGNTTPSSRKGRLGATGGGDDSDEESTSSKNGRLHLPNTLRHSKLERSNRKLKLMPDDASNATNPAPSPSSPHAHVPLSANPLHAASAAAAAAASVAPHSHTHCLFSRYFRVGSREKIKLIIPDPVLVYFGNKKNVNDLHGLGDGGVFGGLPSTNGPSSLAKEAQSNQGHAAIWNHLRAITHGHPCKHADTNHAPNTPIHLDCQIPHISKCGESFPFRYGSLAITNYQLIWIPMLLPQSHPARFGPNHTSHSHHPSHANQYLASDSCPSCQVLPPTHSPAAPHVTATCCSACGCMPLGNMWEHVANNSIAYRSHVARGTRDGHQHRTPVPHHHQPTACETCIPIAPIVLPLLSLARFRLRTFEKADFGLLDLRSKSFQVIRFMFPGLISRNRFGAFRNIAICLDHFSRVTTAVAASANNSGGGGGGHTGGSGGSGHFQSDRPDHGSSSSSSSSDRLVHSSGSSHDRLDEHEVLGLKKICFAWKWSPDTDGFDKSIHGSIESHTQNGTNGAGQTPSANTTTLPPSRRTMKKRNTAHLTTVPLLGATTNDNTSFVGSDELLSETDDSDVDDDDSMNGVGVGAVGVVGVGAGGNQRSRRANLPTSNSLRLDDDSHRADGDDDDDDHTDVVWAPTSLTGVVGDGGLDMNDRLLEQRSLAKSLQSISQHIPASQNNIALLKQCGRHNLQRFLQGWSVYDPIIEYTRLGLLDPCSHYRLTQLNKSYRFSPTYPSSLVVPKGVSDKELETLATFRSKARIPVVVWARRNITNGAASTPPASSSAVPTLHQAGSVANISRVVPNAEVVMLRSAQPMVGITRNRNHMDELYLQWIVANSPCNKRFVIADARPTANAMAQQALGKGYELVENYQSHIIRDISIHFFDIGNIHVMRESEEALSKLCQHYQEGLFINSNGALSQISEACLNVRMCTSNNQHQHIYQTNGNGNGDAPNAATAAATSSAGVAIPSLSAPTCPHACSCTCVSSHVGHHGLADSTSQSWWSSLLATGHFEHLGAILRGVNFIVKTIQGGTSCLVHCSDGWDRTAQLTSLSQLALDPFYRTIHGFFVLISKEWLSFGHKYGHRVGHGGIGGRENSPVFTQFLDCVHQFLVQFPERFEFHTQLLLTLRHSLFSGKYGTWFANSEGERLASANGANGAGAGGSKEHSGITSPMSANPNVIGVGMGSSPSGSLWRLAEKTPSIFAQIWSCRHQFINPTYEYGTLAGQQPFCDYQTEYARTHPLMIDLQKLTFWKEFYLPGISTAPDRAINLQQPTPAAMTPVAASNASSSSSLPVSASTSSPPEFHPPTEESIALRARVAAQQRQMAEQNAIIQNMRQEMELLKQQQQQQQPSSHSLPSPPPPLVGVDVTRAPAVSVAPPFLHPYPDVVDPVQRASVLMATSTSRGGLHTVAENAPQPAVGTSPSADSITLEVVSSTYDSIEITQPQLSPPASISPLECEDVFDPTELSTDATRPRAVRNTGSLINPHLQESAIQPRQSRQRSQSLVNPTIDRKVGPTMPSTRPLSPPPSMARMGGHGQGGTIDPRGLWHILKKAGPTLPAKKRPHPTTTTTTTTTTNPTAVNPTLPNSPTATATASSVHAAQHDDDDDDEPPPPPPMRTANNN